MKYLNAILICMSYFCFLVVTNEVMSASVVWLQGWKLPDMMFASRRSLSDACTSIAKQLETVYSSISASFALIFFLFFLHNNVLTSSMNIKNKWLYFVHWQNCGTISSLGKKCQIFIVPDNSILFLLSLLFLFKWKFLFLWPRKTWDGWSLSLYLIQTHIKQYFCWTILRSQV